MQLKIYSIIIYSLRINIFKLRLFRSQRLTNDDFRRLLMTPRSSSVPSLATPSTAAPVRDVGNKSPQDTEVDDRAERRRKKKR